MGFCFAACLLKDLKEKYKRRISYANGWGMVTNPHCFLAKKLELDV